MHCLRGFESGKGFAQNLRDTLKNMFATLVLKPVIQAVLSPVSNSLASLGQSFAGSIVGAGGASGSGALGSLGSLAGISSMFGVGGLGGSLAAGAGWLTGATTLTGSLAAAGSLIGTGTGAGILSGLGIGLGALGPIGLGVGALAAIFGGGKHGGPKVESGAGLGVRAVDPAASQAVIDAIKQQYGALATGLGGTAGNLDLGVFSAQDPNGTAQTQLAVNAALNGQSIYSRGDRLGGIENVGRSAEELQAAITEESSRVVLKALQATNLPGQIGDWLKQLGDVNKLSGGALTDAVAQAQKFASERQQALDDITSSIDSALAAYRTSATSGMSRNEAFSQIQAAVAISKAGGPMPDATKLKDALSVLSQESQDTFRSQSDFLSTRDSEEALLNALKVQLSSGTASTPAIVRDSASATSASQSATTALQTVAALLSDSNTQLQALGDSSKATARVLTDVVNGGASLAVDVSGA
jgi:hypothetical protein